MTPPAARFLGGNLTAQGGPAACGEVLGTLVCTVAQGAGAQPLGGAAQCVNLFTSLVCTAAAPVMQAGVGCKDVMWTAGCTFAGQQGGGGARVLQADCGNVLTTLACPLSADQARGGRS